MKRRENKGITGFRYVRSAVTTLIDTQSVIWLAYALTGRVPAVFETPEYEPDWNAWKEEALPLYRDGFLVIDNWVQEELKTVSPLGLSLEPGLSEDALLAAVEKHRSKLSPFNAEKHLVDAELLFHAKRDHYFVLSFDAWVVGKAQAMLIAHPSISSMRFKNDGRRKEAFDGWQKG